MTEHPEVGSCELPDVDGRDRQRLHHPFHADAFAWDGITPQVYKVVEARAPGTAWRDVTRHSLTGSGGGPTAFQLRYFEIAPGGYSSFEKHRHIHAIIVLRGTGRVIVGREVFTAEPYDLVYVPSQTPHQFVSAGDEPFGFLCPVDADRDAPQPLTETELQALLDDPKVRAAARVQPPRVRPLHQMG